MGVERGAAQRASSGSRAGEWERVKTKNRCSPMSWPRSRELPMHPGKWGREMKT